MKGALMRYLRLLLMALLTLQATSAAAAAPGAYETEFAKAVDTVLSTGKGQRLIWQAISPYEQVGADLASKFPTADLDFLSARTKNKDDQFSQKLAWVVLAKLSDRKEAREMVIEQAAAGNLSAMFAIALMPETVRREAAESVVRLTKSEETKGSIVTLLGGVGNAQDERLLDDLLRDDENRGVRHAAQASLVFLREKLGRKAEEQRLWSQCAAVCWQGNCEASRPSVPLMKYWWAAEVVVASGVKCPVAFLRCLIKQGEGIAIVLAGLQKEADLIEDLERAAETDLADLAIGNLIQIGTKEAMDAVSRQFKAGALARNKQLVEMLRDSKSSEAIQRLERLGQDEHFKDLRPSIEDAIKRINQWRELEKGVQGP
jgi:hypothetical protein